MWLELEDGRTINDPTPTQIEASLRAQAHNSGFFAILSRTDLTYLQTAGDTDTGFVLEYQDGSIDTHYICTDTSLPLDTIIQVFQRYAVDDSRWESELIWEHQSL